MPFFLSTKAVEKSTYVITVDFTDVAGNAVVPDSIEWTLTDSYNNVINSRDHVDVVAPASTIDIVLSGNDLPCPQGRNKSLILTIEAIYDSTEGSNLPLNDQARFTVLSLRGIS